MLQALLHWSCCFIVFIKTSPLKISFCYCFTFYFLCFFPSCFFKVILQAFSIIQCNLYWRKMKPDLLHILVPACSRRKLQHFKILQLVFATVTIQVERSNKNSACINLASFWVFKICSSTLFPQQSLGKNAFWLPPHFDLYIMIIYATFSLPHTHTHKSEAYILWEHFSFPFSKSSSSITSD